MKKLFTSILLLTLCALSASAQLVYEFTSYTGKSYESFTQTIDAEAVEAAIGCPLAEASAFAVQSDGTEDSNYGLGTTDGWRNADGDWQSWGDNARLCVKADFTLPDNQIYYIGGMYGQTNEPATYAATYRLKNPTDLTKTIDVIIKVNYVVPPVVLLSELKLQTPYVTKNIEQYPRTNQTGSEYSANVSNALAKLGFKDLSQVAANISQYIYVKRQTADFVADDTLVMADNASIYFSPLFDENAGVDLEENTSYDESAECTFYITDYALNDSTGDLSFTLGQYKKLPENTKYSCFLYLVNPETSMALRVKVILTINKNPIKDDYMLSEMIKVGEEDVNLKRDPALGYSVSDYEVDLEKIGALFTEAGYQDFLVSELTFKCLEGEGDDQELNSTYNTNPGEYGFWMTLESYKHAWDTSLQMYFVNSNYLFSDGVFQIGHMPDIFKGGETTSGRLFLTYGQHYYQFNMNIQFGDEADPEAPTPDKCELVSSDAFEFQIVPSADAYQDAYMYKISAGGEAPALDMDYIMNKLGTDSPTLYGYAEAVVDSVDGEPVYGLTYSNAYSCDPKPGFWMTRPSQEYQFNTSTVSTWGNSNTFGICYSNGEFELFQYPGNCAAGDVYDADFFLCNLDEGKKMKIHFTIEYVEERVATEFVGTESVNIIGSEDGSCTEADLTSAFRALGITEEEFAELSVYDFLLAGKSATHYINTSEGNYEDVYPGFPLTKDGYTADETNTILYVGFDQEENQWVATMMDDTDLADGKTIIAHLALTYNNKIYKFDLNVMSEETANGITNIPTAVRTGAKYNLNGQLVDGTYRGIVITDGKKVLVK